MNLKNKTFYRNFFSIYIALVLQNVVTLSVNLADNMMLGAYSETSLAGVAAVNQIQFVYQQFLLALGAVSYTHLASPNLSDSLLQRIGNTPSNLPEAVVSGGFRPGNASLAWAHCVPSYRIAFCRSVKSFTGILASYGIR